MTSPTIPTIKNGDLQGKWVGRTLEFHDFLRNTVNINSIQRQEYILERGVRNYNALDSEDAERKSGDGETPEREALDFR